MTHSGRPGRAARLAIVREHFAQGMPLLHGPRAGSPFSEDLESVLGVTAR